MKRLTVLFVLALLAPTGAAADERFDFAMKVHQAKGRGVNGISAWQVGHDRLSNCRVKSVTDSVSADKIEQMRIGDRVRFRKARHLRLGGDYTVTVSGPCTLRIVGEPDNDPLVYLTPAQ